ncbi:MAG: GTPase Era [Alphaproteobacteria bacterium]|nr:GTPase Era [Alphaproteobacteria bacterium]
MSITKCGFVSIIGRPNAGKSTLLNLLVGEKISIVSPKVQTTRREVRGIIEYNNTQIIFVDTPGICRPNTPLEKTLLSNFKKSCKGSDVTLLLIDCTNKNVENDIKFLQNKKQVTNNFIVAINKIDLIKDKTQLLPIIDKLKDYEFIKQIFLISSMNGEGIEPMKSYLSENMPEGPFLYFDNHDSTDLDLKIRLSEITREKIYNNLDKELPYNIYVTTDKLHVTASKFKILQTIVVMKDSQKGIVLGHKGSMIQKIKRETVGDIRNIFNKTVELNITVKVKEKWTEKKEQLINAGII